MNGGETVQVNKRSNKYNENVGEKFYTARTKSEMSTMLHHKYVWGYNLWMKKGKEIILIARLINKRWENRYMQKNEMLCIYKKNVYKKININIFVYVYSIMYICM